MSAQEKLLVAVAEFCVQDGILRELHRKRKRCEEYERPDPANRYPGNDACDLTGDAENLCGPCSGRVNSLPAYRAAIKARRLAKGRMIRWNARLIAESPR